MRKRWRRGGCAALVAAAAAPATGATAGRRRGGLCRAAIAGAVGGGEDRKLNAGLLAGTLGAGDFLLLVEDNLLEAGVALFTQVFVDRHGGCPLDPSALGRRIRL